LEDSNRDASAVATDAFRVLRRRFIMEVERAG
jgi:hypothetical protein